MYIYRERAHVCIFVYIYIYIERYIYRERERQRYINTYMCVRSRRLARPSPPGLPGGQPAIARPPAGPRSGALEPK